MTHLKHDHGKHFTVYEGPGWALVVYLMTGLALTKIKATPKYLGTREDIENRRKRHWKPFI